jgi:hypothetical protein
MVVARKFRVSRKMTVAAAVAVGLALLTIAGGRLAVALTVDTTHNPKGIYNPEAGMTDAQREALHQQQRTAFEDRYKAWLGSLDPSTIGWASLPRNSIAAGYAPPAPTLAAAIANADDIVIGTVTSMRPVMFGTYSTLALDRTVKGSLPATTVIYQGGWLMPTADWKGASISEADNAPLLIPGDQALLFLTKDPRGDLEIQGFSGYYRVKDGLVAPLRIDGFETGFRGKAVADVAAAIQQAMPPSP